MKNKGLSSKIEDLRNFDNNESPHYSELQVEKIREDLYQIVRMPFMKFSNKEYYSLTSIAYFLTVAFMFLVNAFIGIENEGPLSSFTWEILTSCCAFVEPIITYIIPGVYYYKMSKKEDLINKRL
jgi:hypothetical protein